MSLVHASLKHLVAGLVILSFLFPFQNIPANDIDAIVFQRVNLVVESEEYYSQSLFLEPYATYGVKSNISPIDSLIEEPILSISILSETNSFTMVHRGDTKHAEGEFIPRSTFYVLNITNPGYIQQIALNITISKTENSPNSSVDVPYLDVLILVVPIIVGPIVSLIVVIAIVRIRSKKSQI